MIPCSNDLNRATYLDFSHVDNPDDIDAMYMSPIERIDIKNKYPTQPLVDNAFYFPITLKQQEKVDRPLNVEALIAERAKCAKNYNFHPSSTIVASKEGCPKCGSLLYSECTWLMRPTKSCYQCGLYWDAGNSKHLLLEQLPDDVKKPQKAPNRQHKRWCIIC